MARRDYFGHTNPDGKAANLLVSEAGYPLPPIYLESRDQNSIESIAAGRSSADATWSDWMKSSGHREHLLAEVSFYTAQTCYGVGYYHDPTSRYVDYWVVLTAPPTAPQLRVASPDEKERVTESQITVRGITSGIPGAAAVEFALESPGLPLRYTRADGIRDWSGSLTGLVPGENIIRVRSVDAAGTKLAEVRRTVRFVVLSDLVMSVAGEGAISAGFAGTSSREIGRQYTVTATPAAGTLFAGWSGGISGSTPTITFVMTPGLTATATFVPNPFATRQGAYAGLLNGTTYATSGLLRIQLGSRGAFTARLMLGGKNYRASATFDAQGSARVTIRRPDGTPLTFTLQLDLSISGASLSGAVTIGDATFPVALRRLPAGGESRFAGRFTFHLSAADDSSSAAPIPLGDGYGLLTIGSNGSARVAGSLADGTPFACGSFVSGAGEIPLCVSLYTRRGSLAGELQIEGTNAERLDAVMRWSRPARPGARFYPAGFDIAVNATGARYVAPGTNREQMVASINAVAATTADLVFSNGNLEQQILQPALLAETSRVILAAPLVAPRLAIKVNAASGRFRGEFVHPVTRAETVFRGVLIQPDRAGFGFFLGANESGFAGLLPR
jgi:hypothetical protein